MLWVWLNTVLNIYWILEFKNNKQTTKTKQQQTHQYLDGLKERRIKFPNKKYNYNLLKD